MSIDHAALSESRSSALVSALCPSPSDPAESPESQSRNGPFKFHPSRSESSSESASWPDGPRVQRHVQHGAAFSGPVRPLHHGIYPGSRPRVTVFACWPARPRFPSRADWVRSAACRPPPTRASDRRSGPRPPRLLVPYRSRRPPGPRAGAALDCAVTCKHPSTPWDDPRKVGTKCRFSRCRRPYAGTAHR